MVSTFIGFFKVSCVLKYGGGKENKTVLVHGLKNLSIFETKGLRELGGIETEWDKLPSGLRR
jgi:hypothetical protein